MTADRALGWALRASAAVSGAVVVLVFAYLFSESAPVLRRVGLLAFVHDARWAPTAGLYNHSPMIAATALVTLGALALAAPVGLAFAAVTVFYAPPKLSRALSTVTALLAGIPSVVYGLWGLVRIAPRVGAAHPPGLCLLTAVLVLGLMVTPTVSALAEGALRQVPVAWIEGAAALGLGRWATLWRVVVPGARGGLATALLLAMGRAAGETMAVIMVAGNTVQLPRSVFDPLRTLTANVALEMSYAMGDHRAALFVSGLTLLVLVTMLVTLADLARRAA